MAVEPCTRYAVVIGNSQYTQSRECRGVLLPALEAAPLGPHYDANLMAGELVKRGFEVSRHFDLEACGVSAVLAQFCQAVTHRRLFKRGGNETLLLYYSGHGIQQGLGASGHPLAVGVDAKEVDLHSMFVTAVDAIDGSGGNSIFLLMDACMHYAGCCADPAERTTCVVRNAVARMASARLQKIPMHIVGIPGKDSREAASSNLQVFARSYLRDPAKSGHEATGALTRAVLRSMDTDDSDVVSMLERAQADRTLQSRRGQGLAWTSNHGSHTTCSFTAPLPLQVESIPTGTTVVTITEAGSEASQSLSHTSGNDEEPAGTSSPTDREHVLKMINRMLDVVGNNVEILCSFQSFKLELQRCRLDKPARFQGGQSVVQLVCCKESHNDYALKIYACQESFEAEKGFYLHSAASEHSSLGNNFLQCHEVVESSEADLHASEDFPMPPLLLMERGESLELYMRQAWPGRMAAFNVRFMFLLLPNVIRSVAQRLCSLHDAGMVHRNIKRADIMWLQRLHAWTVIDFSCVVEQGQRVAPVLTLPYAAPEALQAVVQGRSMAAHASLDCWALGVLAYEILTGKHWVPSEASVDEVIDCMLERKGSCLPSARSLHADEEKACYGRMHAPLTALLHRDASRRGSCRDVVAALDAMLDSDCSMPPARNLPAASRGHRHFALVIGNGDYQCDHLHSLRCPMHDAYRMQQELQARGFKVTLNLNKTGAGMLMEVGKFVDAFARRQHACAHPEILLVYYSGHGALSKQSGAPCAVGTDGRLTNLQKSFLTAADCASVQKSNAFVLLADSCLVGSRQQPDGMLYGMWTSCLLEALLLEDPAGADLMRVLAQAGRLMAQRDKRGTCHPPYCLYTPGELSTVSFARSRGDLAQQHGLQQPTQHVTSDSYNKSPS